MASVVVTVVCSAPAAPFAAVMKTSCRLTAAENAVTFSVESSSDAWTLSIIKPALKFGSLADFMMVYCEL